MFLSYFIFVNEKRIDIESTRKGAGKLIAYLAETLDDPIPRLILQFGSITPVSIGSITLELKKDTATIKSYVEKLVEDGLLTLRPDNHYETSEIGKLILDKDFIKNFNEVVNLAIDYIKSLYDK